MKKRHFWMIIYILMTAFIFSRSFKPASASLDESRGFVVLLEKIIKPLLSSPPENLRSLLTTFVRKTAHIAEFTALSCVACRVVCLYGKRIADFLGWVLFSGILTACIDEAIQLTSEGRGGLITDVFIDFSGTVIGVLISFFVVWLLKKHTK